MYTLYILHSKSFNRYYVGYTNDIARRLTEHNRIKGKFTDVGIPWILVYTESFASKKEAMDREKFIKSRKSKSFIRELIAQQ
jgi:putative endonuclease